MISQKDLEKAKEITEKFFQKMTIQVEIKVKAQKEQTFSIDLETENPQILIGEGGRTLAEIQHLLRLILRKKLFSSKENDKIFFVDLDIVDYKKKKYQHLKELARSIADEVALSKKEKNLPSMSAAERRIIHLELADRSDVVTESLGQEPERSIVIRPHP
ncbi:MAG TPA: KH domain-containing protein [Candidatus Nealsonbacteria bacterium]|uniref:R3H domain-containing protein n=1 Tax=marine sediment metagenome TaxID=412755 RepID=A0A0F9UZE7_9ZZZZ|nr:KH domain-containing protein [Candidatus Nealsonbacteria bacterium]HEB46265.1 KH domain-containing protein [Candidatus Nealsonbacteria bacterium]